MLLTNSLLKKQGGGDEDGKDRVASASWKIGYEAPSMENNGGADRRTRSKLVLERKAENILNGTKFVANRATTSHNCPSRAASTYSSSVVPQQHRDVDKTALFGLGWRANGGTRSALRQTRRAKDVAQLEACLQMHLNRVMTSKANSDTDASDSVSNEQRRRMTKTRSAMISERRAAFANDSAKFEPRKEPGIHQRSPPPLFEENSLDLTPWWKLDSTWVDDPSAMLENSTRLRRSNNRVVVDLTKVGTIHTGTVRSKEMYTNSQSLTQMLMLRTLDGRAINSKANDQDYSRYSSIICPHGSDHRARNSQQ